MKKLTQLYKWALRAWPFWVVVLVGALHYLLLIAIPLDTRSVNKIVAATLQVVGGLIVLYSLNENIGLFRKENLLSMAICWLREFLLIRRSATINMQAACSAVSMTGSVSVHVKHKCETVEERLEELQRQIDDCRQLVNAKEKEIHLVIGKAKEELQKDIHTNRESIREVNSLLHGPDDGGIKAQLLGVLL